MTWNQKHISTPVSIHVSPIERGKLFLLKITSFIQIIMQILKIWEKKDFLQLTKILQVVIYFYEYAIPDM